MLINTKYVVLAQVVIHNVSLLPQFSRQKTKNPKIQHTRRTHECLLVRVIVRETSVRNFKSKSLINRETVAEAIMRYFHVYELDYDEYKS